MGGKGKLILTESQLTNAEGMMNSKLIIMVVVNNKTRHWCILGFRPWNILTEKKMINHSIRVLIFLYQK